MARQTPALPGQDSLKSPSRVTRGPAGEAQTKGAGGQRLRPLCLESGPRLAPALSQDKAFGRPLPGVLALRPAPLPAPSSRFVLTPKHPLKPFVR